MDFGTALIWLLVLAFFILLSGLFVAAEYSLVRLRKSQVEELLRQRMMGAATIKDLLDNMDRTVAGAQLGITIGGLAVGGVGQEPIRYALQAGLDALLAILPFLDPVEVPGLLALAVSFLILTVSHVIVGEQVPKLLAIRNPVRIALLLCMPFAFFCRLTTPILWLVNKITTFIFRVCKIAGASNTGHSAPSPLELQILIEESARAGTLGRDESDLLHRALELRGLAMRDIMVPLSLVDCLSEDLSLYEAVEIISSNRHSRLPLYRGHKQVITGILNTRELLDLFKHRLRREVKSALALHHAHLQGHESQIVAATLPVGKLKDYIRKPYFVSVDAQAAQVLQELRRLKLQMAVVLDDEGKACGLATQEDLLEALVGEIYDEYDKPIDGIKPLPDGSFQVDGDLTLFEFRKVFDVRLVSTEDDPTVGGVVAEALGVDRRRVGEVVELTGFVFKVLALNKDGHIDLLYVREIPPEPDPPEDQGSLSGDLRLISNLTKALHLSQ
jgi:CBS domain containing-hemolysin-like protein